MKSDNNELPDLLIRQCPDGIIFADTSGRIELWNAAAEHIFGYPRDKVMGESLDIIIPEQLRAKHWHGFNQAVQNRQVKNKGAALPTKAIRHDGTSIYVELSFAVVLDENGTALGALAQVRDITQRFEEERETRKRLRELEQKLNAE